MIHSVLHAIGRLHRPVREEARSKAIAELLAVSGAAGRLPHFKQLIEDIVGNQTTVLIQIQIRTFIYVLSRGNLVMSQIR